MKIVDKNAGIHQDPRSYFLVEDDESIEVKIRVLKIFSRINTAIKDVEIRIIE